MGVTSYEQDGKTFWKAYVNVVSRRIERFENKNAMKNLPLKKKPKSCTKESINLHVSDLRGVKMKGLLGARLWISGNATTRFSPQESFSLEQSEIMWREPLTGRSLG